MQPHVSSQKLIGNELPLGTAVPQEFYYHIPWRAKSVQAGSHKTNLRGAGSDFSAFVPFLDCPNPTRLDVRASIRTVPRQLMVKTFFERSAIKVYAVNDISASMRFRGVVKKDMLLAQIVESIAWSSARQGDAFGMVSCDNQVRSNASMSLTYRKSAALEAHRKIIDFFAKNTHSTQAAMALPCAAQHLSLQKSLVFLISDFHLPEEIIKNTLQSLSLHDVIPVVLWDKAEFEQLPTWGWTKIREIETGEQRSLFMRPALHKDIREFVIARKKSLIAISQSCGTRMPFFVMNDFDATAFSRHLLGG